MECKASVKEHESPTKGIPKKYAVDGVMHYAQFLKDDFNVIAIAWSGETEQNSLLSIFQWNKKEARYFPKKYSEISTYDDYYSLFHSSDNEVLSEEELLSYAKKLHEEMRDEAKLKEAEKPLLVGALLLALDNGDFTKEFPTITKPPEELSHAKVPAKKKPLKKRQKKPAIQYECKPVTKTKWIRPLAITGVD